MDSLHRGKLLRVLASTLDAACLLLMLAGLKRLETLEVVMADCIAFESLPMCCTCLCVTQMLHE